MLNNYVFPYISASHKSCSGGSATQYTPLPASRDFPRRGKQVSWLPLRGSWRRSRLKGCISKCMYLYSYTTTKGFFSGLSRGRGLLYSQSHVICIESLGFQRRLRRGTSNLKSQISTLKSQIFLFPVSHFEIFLKKFHFPCSQNATSRYVYSREVNQGPAA